MATTPSLVAHDRPGPFAFALDENDVPHIAYVVQWPERRKRQLVHARPRTPADSAHPPGAYYRDEDTMLERCATMIASELGEARAPGKVGAAHRWCGPDSSLALPTLAELTVRCDARDASACLVAGFRAGKPPTLMSLEMADCRASSSAKACFGSANLVGARAEWLSAGDDRPMALKYLDKACALGSKAACAVVGWNEQEPARSIEMFGRACSAELPTACAALLLKLREAADRTQLTHVRTVLATACGSSDKPDACNSLAYMEEVGLGGKKRAADAMRHHLRACELGSVRSCARILTGPRSPPRPPASLDKEAFRDQMSTNCTVPRKEVRSATSTCGVPHERNTNRWARSRTRRRAVSSPDAMSAATSWAPPRTTRLLQATKPESSESAKTLNSRAKLAERTRLELAASGVTGRRYNQLNYRSRTADFQ